LSAKSRLYLGLPSRSFVELAFVDALLEADDAEPGRGTVDDAALPMLVLPVKLPMRSRGTRVWIFCSRFFTLALISDTICTPLLFIATAGVEVALELEGMRAEDVEGRPNEFRMDGARI
jgi:hypothetical protein